MAPPLITRNALRKDILKAKLEAIRSGKLTDTVFLVGANGSNKLWEVHAIKAVMIVMSEFMVGLFNSPMGLTNPIRITSFNHFTFKLVVEFAHLNELLSQINLDEAIDLAIAADVLLMDSLKKYCKHIIESKVTETTLWTVLDKLLKFNLHDVAEACMPCLADNTKICISRQEAKNISEESVIFLLSLKNLAIKSEKELVDFCSHWAKGKKPNGREALRRLLPHLRLLSLTPLETTELPPNFLTTDEKLAVLEANVKKLQTRAALNKFPKNLSTETNTRSAVTHNQPLIVTFLSSSDRRNLIRISSRELISFSNTLLVVPKDNVNLVKVNFLGCHAKADRSLTEKILFNVTVAVDDNAQKCNFEMFLYKGEKGRLKLRKPIFLPKNKETKITLTISWVGTAYFLNQKVSSTIDCSRFFKKVCFGKNADVVFFDSFGYVGA